MHGHENSSTLKKEHMSKTLCLFTPEPEARPLRFKVPGTYLHGPDTSTAFHFSFNNEIK